MPTGKAIRLEVARTLSALGQARGEARRLVEVTNSGTLTTGVTDAIRLQSSALLPQSFQNWWVRESDGSGSPPDGDLVRATTLAPSTGVLSVSPDFAAALAANDALELYHPDDNPDTFDEARDRALTQRCMRWRLNPLTWLTDGDFVISGVDNWTGSSATPTKVEKSNIERFAEQTLRVANSGANGYAGQTIKNPLGAASGGQAQQIFFFVLVQADVGVAELILYDVTNSAALDLSANRATWDGEAFATMRGTAEALATTEEISVRPGGQGATADTYWTSMCVYPVNAQQFVLPARITSKKFVGRFYELTGTEWPNLEPVALEQQPKLYDVGGGSIQVQFDEPVGQRAIFWEELAHYAALQTDYHTPAQRLAGDAATTDCELDYVKWATLEELYPGQFTSQWLKVHGEKGPAPRVRWPHGAVYS